MKTSLDIPEDLYREVKIKAAKEGRKVSDIVTEGLRMVLTTSPNPRPKIRLSFPLLPKDRNRPIVTAEMVNRALNEDEDERLAPFFRH